MAESLIPRPSGTFTALKLKAFAESLRKQAMRVHEMTKEEFHIYERIVRESDEFLATHRPVITAKTFEEGMQRLMDAVSPPPLTREERKELMRKLESNEDLTEADVEMLNRIEPEVPVQKDFSDRVMEKLTTYWEKEKG